MIAYNQQGVGRVKMDVILSKISELDDKYTWYHMILTLNTDIIIKKL